jgi:predicted NodU family carbamoyl transferase
MLIVGLNAYHGDVAAAVLRDGQLIAALEEERFSRIKHVAGFPARAIERGLAMAGRLPADVDVWAIARGRRVHLLQKAWFALTHRPGAPWSVNTGTPPASTPALRKRSPARSSWIPRRSRRDTSSIIRRTRRARITPAASMTPPAARSMASVISSACRPRAAAADGST